MIAELHHLGREALLAHPDVIWSLASTNAASVSTNRDNTKVCIKTRLHPQGKGGPQVILCERRLNLCQKCENIPTEWTPKSSIFDSRPFTSRGLLIEKSVFLAGRVLRDVGMFLQNWLIHWFQLIADALTMPPKKCVPGAAAQWQNGRKSVRRRRRRRTHAQTHKFKRRPHKMPFGQ